MQLIWFIAFVMTVFFVFYQKMLDHVYMLEKSEDQFLFFMVIHQKWLMKSFSLKRDAF